MLVVLGRADAWTGRFWPAKPECEHAQLVHSAHVACVGRLIARFGPPHQPFWEACLRFRPEFIWKRGNGRAISWAAAVLQHKSTLCVDDSQGSQANTARSVARGARCRGRGVGGAAAPKLWACAPPAQRQSLRVTRIAQRRARRGVIAKESRGFD